MIEHDIKVTTSDGLMDTFLALPDGRGPFPPVILYMDIWGMRDQLRDIARFAARQGLACAAPSLYYRQGDTHFVHQHPDGRTKSISILSQTDRQKMLDYNAHLTDDMVIADTLTLISRLREVDNVSDGFAGCFGYCMGGRHVIRVAAAHSEIFRATASFHGTYLVTEKPNSPHLCAHDIQGKIYFGMGENDPFTPRRVVTALMEAFDDSPAKATFRIHGDTDHGYAIPDRDVYNSDATNADWQEIFSMFRRML